MASVLCIQHDASTQIPPALRCRVSGMSSVDAGTSTSSWVGTRPEGLKRRPHDTCKNARNPRRTPRSYGRTGHRSPDEYLRHPRGCLAYPNCAQNVASCRSHGDFPGRYRQRVCIAQRQYIIWFSTLSCSQGGRISTMLYQNSLGTRFLSFSGYLITVVQETCSQRGSFISARI